MNDEKTTVAVSVDTEMAFASDRELSILDPVWYHDMCGCRELTQPELAEICRLADELIEEDLEERGDK